MILFRSAAALAAVTLVYCAVSVWLVALPDTVPVLVTSGVSILTAHFTYQLVVVPTHDNTDIRTQYRIALHKPTPR